MKTPILIIAIAMGAGLTFTPAFAQEREQIDFATLDTDGDGEITVADFEAAQAARFAEADTDGDGALSEAELIAQAEVREDNRAARMVARMIERVDTNDDGVLQQEELQEARGDGMSRRFDRIDADEDGAISAEEFEAADNDRGDRRHGDKGRGHGGKDRGDRPGRG